MAGMGQYICNCHERQIYFLSPCVRRMALGGIMMPWWCWILGWFVCFLAIWALLVVAHGEPKRPGEEGTDDS